MHNPLNAYNLIRHVAVGWAVVEAAIEEDRGRRGGNIGKRMSHVLARRDKKHVPKEEDVDGVARGIVRYTETICIFYGGLMATEEEEAMCT